MVISNRPRAVWPAGILLGLLILGIPAGIAQQSISRVAALPIIDPAHLAKEVFEYSIEWKLITAGTAKLTFSPMPHSAVATGELRLHLESSGLVSKFIRVNDDYTSMLGQNFCGQSTFLAAREGSRAHETRVTFDTKANRASYLERDLVKKTTATHEVDISPCTFDVLGALMVLRNLNLEPGKSATIPVSDGKKMVWAKVESQRRETIKGPLGTTPTIVYEVFLFNNVLYKRPAHLHIWLTEDKRRIPVQLQVRLQFTIGTITFRLEKEEKS